MPRYGTVDRDYGMRLATCPPDHDGPIYMLNLMKYRGVADYGDARPAERGTTGREADDIYSPVEVLHDIGAAITFTGEVVDSTEDWDRVAVVRYPTRRSFIDMQSRRDFQDKHTHKEAGMDHTIVVGSLPRSVLPARAKPGRVLVEIWQGPEPAARIDGPSATFAVEGTIIGDGRSWSEVRYTSLVPDCDVTLPAASTMHQLVVVQPTIDRWQ